jgi:hypothetical protein
VSIVGGMSVIGSMANCGRNAEIICTLDLA